MMVLVKKLYIKEEELRAHHQTILLEMLEKFMKERTNIIANNIFSTK